MRLSTFISRAIGPRINWRGWAALVRYGALCLLVNVIGNTALAETRILALGDSLTAGYGLSAQESLPSQLEQALRQRGHDVRVINAGVSGDTTAGGVARLDWALGDDPDVAIVALGANDGLRGIEPARIEDNLDTILSRLKAEDVRVVLAGMLAPPNMGEDYAREFNAIFPRLARRHDVAFYPFLLDGVVADRTLNLPDGIHPTGRGVAIMVERLLPTVEKVLQ